MHLVRGDGPSFACYLPKQRRYIGVTPARLTADARACRSQWTSLPYRLRLHRSRLAQT